MEEVVDYCNEGLNEMDNLEKVKQLSSRVEDWKGHKLDRFGKLLLHGQHSVLKSDVGSKGDKEREVRHPRLHLFNLMHIFNTPQKPRSARKNSSISQKTSSTIKESPKSQKTSKSKRSSKSKKNPSPKKSPTHSMKIFNFGSKKPKKRRSKKTTKKRKIVIDVCNISLLKTI